MAVIVNGKKVAGLGQPGKDGAPGKSAYQAAKEKGYTGTEEEFNTALAGMQSAPFLPLAGGVVTGNLILGVDSSSGSALYIGSENGAQVVFDSTWRLRVLADTIIFGQNSNDQKSLIFHNGQIKNLSLPGSPNDAANKQYVDEHTGAKVVTGSYVGTGTYGSGNRNRLVFPSQPKVIFISGALRESNNSFVRNGMAVMYSGVSDYVSTLGMTYASSAKNTNDATITWSGNEVSWWTSPSSSDASYTQYAQLNGNGITYHYTAIL